MKIKRSNIPGKRAVLASPLLRKGGSHRPCKGARRQAEEREWRRRARAEWPEG